VFILAGDFKAAGLEPRFTERLFPRHPGCQSLLDGHVEKHPQFLAEFLLPLPSPEHSAEGDGPICGRANVGEGRDFLVAIRDRIQARLAKGRSVEDVVAANPLHDLFKGRTEVPPERWARLVYQELARDQNLTAAIHDLATRNHAAGIQLVMAGGADINARDCGARTALHYPAMNDADEATALLVGKGANLESQNSYGRTPLNVAAEMKQAKVRDLLIAQGAEISIGPDVSTAAGKNPKASGLHQHPEG
jgi:hypothetical protein